MTGKIRQSISAKASLLLAVGAAMLAQTLLAATDDAEFANKSIEELMNVDVTSVARKEQKLSRTPAAVFVITQEMIERSGMTTIPDLLRIAPGVQVAQIDAGRWAISVRGFNGVYSNKLLVLVDGRTVYTTTFSGVYWDQVTEIPLETIERIEVVRGSGGAVWGANAVNGVINIITKRATETTGGRMEAGAGSSQVGDYLAQYGQKLSNGLSYRAFGGYQDFGSTIIPGIRQSAQDGWDIGHGGIRVEAGDERKSKDSFYAEVNGFSSTGNQFLMHLGQAGVGSVLGITDSGFDATSRWTHNYSDNNQMSVQVYDNYYSRNDTGIAETNNTVDIDFQDHIQVGSRNDVVWGAEYRFTSEASNNSLGGPAPSYAVLGYFPQLNPASLQYSQYSAFAQDDFQLTSALTLTAGSKIEHGLFSNGVALEPTVRIAWTPTDKTTLWAAASQALRQPSRVETAIDIAYNPVPLMPGLVLNFGEYGNKDLQSEKLRDYEFGYRVMPNSKLSFDLATFYGHYRDLSSVGLEPINTTFGATGAELNVPMIFRNGINGHGYGAELAAAWKVSASWRLSATYSRTMLFTNLTDLQDFQQGAGIQIPGINFTPAGVQDYALSSSLDSAIPPKNQAGVQSFWDVSKRFGFDTGVFFVGAMPRINVPAYTRVDAHLSYKFNDRFAARLSGQNLAQPHHVEYENAAQFIATEAPRSIFGSVIFKF